MCSGVCLVKRVLRLLDENFQRWIDIVVPASNALPKCDDLEKGSHQWTREKGHSEDPPQRYHKQRHEQTDGFAASTISKDSSALQRTGLVIGIDHGTTFVLFIMLFDQELVLLTRPSSASPVQLLPSPTLTIFPRRPEYL